MPHNNNDYSSSVVVVYPIENNHLEQITIEVTCVFCHLAALVTDQVEMKYKEMRRKKRMAELASDIWSDWHQAQANRNPSQYQDILKYNDINKANKSPF